MIPRSLRLDESLKGTKFTVIHKQKYSDSPAKNFKKWTTLSCLSSHKNMVAYTAAQSRSILRYRILRVNICLSDIFYQDIWESVTQIFSSFPF